MDVSSTLTKSKSKSKSKSKPNSNRKGLALRGRTHPDGSERMIEELPRNPGHRDEALSRDIIEDNNGTPVTKLMENRAPVTLALGLSLDITLCRLLS